MKTTPHFDTPPFAYPAGLTEAIALRDGRSVTLRPVLPQDATLLQSFVAGLSSAARRFRFHGCMKGLSDAAAARLTVIDYERRMAFVATLDEAGAQTVVGEACWCAEDDGASAEFGIAVADAWTGQGLGSALIEALARSARYAGFDWLRGEVLADNGRMLAMMRRCGFRVAAHGMDSALVRVQRATAAASVLEGRLAELLWALAPGRALASVA